MSLHINAGLEPVSGYRLVRMLGQGGFGQVWEATAPGGFSIALKFIRVDTVQAAPEQRALEVIRQIRHPHLLDIQFAVQVDDYLIIAMPLCDRNLWDRFCECQELGLPGIPHDELNGYMEDAAKAIDFLNEPRHQAGHDKPISVQHRDIKPLNLFIVGGSVRVADFGLVKILENSVTAHTGCMTPQYAAPETFEGKITSRSDQYSLAVTYCQLRGGQLPFTGAINQIIYGHLSKEPDLSGLPEEERPIVAKALSKQASDRWQSCQAFVHALKVTALAPVYVDAHTPPPLPVTHFPSVPERDQSLVTTTNNYETMVPVAKPPTVQPLGAGRRRSRRLPLAVAALLFILIGGGAAFLFRDYLPGFSPVLGDQEKAEADRRREEEERRHKEELERIKQQVAADRRNAEENEKRHKEELERTRELAAIEQRKAEEAQRRLAEAERRRRDEDQKRAEEELRAKQQTGLEQDKAEEARRKIRELDEANRRRLEEDRKRAEEDRKRAEEELRRREAEALSYKAVVTIENPLDFTNGHVVYKLRWRRFDGSWTDWDTKELKNKHYYYHWMAGATDVEIEFDCVAGDGEYTAKRYNLAFVRVKKDGKDINDKDGKRYYFEFKDQKNLDLHHR